MVPKGSCLGVNEKKASRAGTTREGVFNNHRMWCLGGSFVVPARRRGFRRRVDNRRRTDAGESTTDVRSRSVDLQGLECAHAW